MCSPNGENRRSAPSPGHQAPRRLVRPPVDRRRRHAGDEGAVALAEDLVARSSGLQPDRHAAHGAGSLGRGRVARRRDEAPTVAWTESVSPSFRARHESEDADDVAAALEAMERLRDRLDDGLLERTPGDVTA